MSISLIHLSCILTFLILGCSRPAKVEEVIKLNMDSVYMQALKVAFKGKCFYSPLPPTKYRDTLIDEAIFNESYFYFAKKFETFKIDSTLEFEFSELNELIRKPESILEIDSFDLSSCNNINLDKVPVALEEFEFNELSKIGFQEIQTNKLFSGYIIFSKPLIKMNTDQSYELFIRVVKMIDSPRNCYVRLLVKGNIIVESNELVYHSKLTFR